MLSIKTIMKFFDYSFIIKFCLLGLLFSMLPLFEVYLLFRLYPYMSMNILLAITAATGLLGVLLVLQSTIGILKSLDTKVRIGEYPQTEFAGLAGAITAGILLIFPGLITDAIGLLCFLPFIRNAVGNLVNYLLGSRLKDAYEYLKLFEL